MLKTFAIVAGTPRVSTKFPFTAAKVVKLALRRGCSGDVKSRDAPLLAKLREPVRVDMLTADAPFARHALVRKS